MSGPDTTSSKESPDPPFEHENMTSLSSYVTSKCEAKEEIEWNDLMEWFVCAVIGIESKASCVDSLEAFDWDHVMVDRLGIARIIVVPSNSGSSPPNSTQSFSEDISSLSLLFFSLIEHLSTSKCLSKHVEKHQRNNLIHYVLHHLINHLISTDTLVPICDQSKIEELINNMINTNMHSLTDIVDLPETLLILRKWAYILVHYMEVNDFIDTTVRLTNPAIDAEIQTPQRPLNHNEQELYWSQLEHFETLIDPEFVKIGKQYDSDLYEDAARISSWTEFLERVASGAEVVNDTSFLKMPFFRPTLLSLQATFQQLASSLDGSDENSTSNPPTSYDPPLSPYLPSPFFSSQTDSNSNQNTPAPSVKLIKPENLDHSERFSSSLFDEADDEILARSLVRCLFVSDLIGPDICIRDIPEFFDRTVSLLGSSNYHFRETAFLLFTRLLETSQALSMLPRLWNRLHFSFRDGQLDEQRALIRISVRWISSTIVGDLKEMFRSVRLQHNTHLSRIEADILTHCMSLEWLNIPTGFGSALAYSNTFLSHDLHNYSSPPIPPPDMLNSSVTPTIVLWSSSKLVTVVDGRVTRIGSFIRDLRHSNANTIVFDQRKLPFFCKMMLSPVPVEVSVALEAVKRVVSVSTAGILNVMVCWGMFDIVIRAVSESSFLEDYENGICVIGSLLHCIHDIRIKLDFFIHNFPSVSRT
ncbi:hypothetical protein BLNAU_5128 [Blattamonas nauphoetae]|uniref:Uncharacterized protein n=1 Tax=Blattamonas nauphoetae TaxID=2049346 RepID=A0ABQ9Y895_9EUKA|nr:hypothetical protein BLNAU_5128 [Blattamonas nauphoetae]